MKTTLRKSLVAVAVLAAWSGARAEGSYVEVYGILDVGVATVAHSLPANNALPAGINPLNTGGMDGNFANRESAMVNGGMQYSRWGIKGSEDLGGGAKAIFTFESGFNPLNGALTDNSASVLANAASNGGTANSSSNGAGSVNGQIFGRQAWVGFSEPDWGTVMFGRNYNQIYDVMSAYDPVFKSDIMSPLGFSGTLGGGGGVTENTRIDNSIKYKNQFGAVNVGALYKLGASDGSAPGIGYALNVGYEEGAFGIQGVYEQFRDVGNLGISSGRATVTVYDTEAWLLAAKYKFDKLTVKGGFELYKLRAPSNAPATAYDYFGTSAIVGAAGTDVAAVGYSAAPQEVKVAFIGGDYNLTQAFNIAVGLYDVRYESYLSGGTQKPAGDIYWSTVVADYRFSKRTDVYGGFVYINYSGDKYASAIYKTNSLGMVGIRHKF